MEQLWTHWITPDQGVRYRVGTAEDAGRICKTRRAPNGIDGHQYRRLVQRPAKSYPAAPGPMTVGNPPLVLTNATGEKLYDLDAVQAWHNGRPGSGWARKLVEREESDTDDDALAVAG